ncbi:MAG: hypothetical protein IKR84_05555, partial [Oscillibacter sp.]|nr:hypothetical protein [Oscillibacter sp.]
SSNTLTEHLQEGYIGFTHFKPVDLGPSYNTVVSNGQTIATLNFQPASDAARSQTAQLSFVNTTGMTSQVGFFEGLSSTSSTAYTLNLDAPHTVPALNPSGTTHTVTVNGGHGSGTYAVGDSVAIEAGRPSEGQQFSGWTGTDSLTFDRTASSTTFIMPDYDVTVTATYAPTPTTDPGTVALAMSGAAWQGDIYSVNITASGGAGDSFPLCGAEIWVHFDPNVLTFASAQLRNKIAPIEVEDPEDPLGDPMSVSISSNTLTSRVSEGYFGFVYFMPPDLTQSYNFPVNNGQTIATLNFRPARDAAQSQASEISFVNAAGMTSQIGFFESTTSTSSTAYTLNPGAAHTVPAFSPSPDVCEIIFAARDWEGNLSVTLTNPISATLAVSYFDARGKFMSAALQPVAGGAGTASVDIPAGAATASVMLFDTGCRPLCAPFEGPIG